MRGEHIHPAQAGDRHGGSNKSSVQTVSPRAQAKPTCPHFMKYDGQQALQPIRVGLLFEFGSLNGGEFSMLAALSHIPRDEVAIVAFSPADGPLQAALRSQQVPWNSLPDSVLNRNSPHWKREWIAWLRGITANFQLQLLHANSLTMSRRLGLAASELTCRTTGHVRDIMKLSQGAIRELNQHVQLVAVSHAVRQSLLEQGIQQNRVQTIYNGIDPHRFFPVPRTGGLRHELGLSNDVQLAATIGQICLRKGQNDLAACAVLLRDRFPQLHFLLVGQRHSLKTESIEFDRAISKTFRSAGMEHRLHRLHFRHDIPAILNEIDLLIHPARQEPLGRVLLEAAACGVPIVTTNVGGTSEILTHLKTGWLVPAADPAALATGVAALLNHPEHRQHLGSAAASTIANRFHINTAVESLILFWQAAAENLV